MHLVAIGDKVPPGTYQFHSRFDHVVNYRNESCIISFIDHDKNLSGRTLLVSELPRGEAPVVVRGAEVAVAQTRVCRARAHRYDSTFEGFSPEQDLTTLIHTMKSVLEGPVPDRSLAALHHPRHRPAFSSAFEKAVLDRLTGAFETLKKGDILGSVEQFKGVGFGLTPSGDDFIIGLLYALSSLSFSGTARGVKKEILEMTAGCTALSLQFMRDAEAGIFPRDIKELFTAARCGDEEAMNRRLHDILKHGHSSGADTIAGMVAGFEWFFTQRDSETAGRTRG
jgi:hypothetical protein